MDIFKVGEFVYGEYGSTSYVEGYIVFIDEDGDKIKIKCDNAFVTLDSDAIHKEIPEKLKKFWR